MDAAPQIKQKSSQINAVTDLKADASAPTSEKIRQAFESGKYPYGRKMARCIGITSPLSLSIPRQITPRNIMAGPRRALFPTILADL